MISKLGVSVWITGAVFLVLLWMWLQQEPADVLQTEETQAVVEGVHIEPLSVSGSVTARIIDENKGFATMRVIPENERVTRYMVGNWDGWWADKIGTGVRLNVREHGRVWEGSAEDLRRLMFPPEQAAP